jgi:class 3 adenylate cyclase
MFCDLVGSTALSARLDPEDMREIIGAYHRCCAGQITRAGGFVAKYMGDGVLAYFGYPRAHEDDAERAIRAGLGLIEAVATLHSGRDATLQARIGIATGLVVVGDLIGEGAAREEGVVGETPNIAARLQARADPGQVVVAHSTQRLAGGLFAYRDLGRIALKGLADPVRAWQVTGAGAAQSRFEALHGASLTPLVGREEELELLLRRWQRAKSGEGQVVLISGEPGIGKSRLTAALQERLQPEPHASLRYFCSPQHTDSAFHPVIAQLEAAAGFERQDSPDSKLDKLAALLRASSGQEGGVRFLAELLAVSSARHSRPLNLSPQRQKEETFDVLLAQLAGLARRQPALVLYEDVHWIDPSSRDLLDRMVDRVIHLPVLVVITFRPEFKPPWIGQAHATMLVINRLARQEGLELVGKIAGNALSVALVAEIVERSDGVPLFAEELTRSVVEAGSHDDAAREAVAAAPLPARAVPATLYASLMARLDRLGIEAKQIAQMGAAIGREFSWELLKAVARKPESELQAALDRLTEAQLVFRRGVLPEGTFLFKHALVRDAAYGSLLRGQRRELQGRIASAIESDFAEVGERQPEILARHLSEAGQTERAVEQWLKAGRRAAGRSAHLEAIAHLKQGLELLGSLPDGPRRSTIEKRPAACVGGVVVRDQRPVVDRGGHRLRTGASPVRSERRRCPACERIVGLVALEQQQQSAGRGPCLGPSVADVERKARRPRAAPAGPARSPGRRISSGGSRSAASSIARPAKSYTGRISINPTSCSTEATIRASALGWCRRVTSGWSGAAIRDSSRSAMRCASPKSWRIHTACSWSCSMPRFFIFFAAKSRERSPTSMRPTRLPPSSACRASSTVASSAADWRWLKTGRMRRWLPYVKAWRSGRPRA